MSLTLDLTGLASEIEQHVYDRLRAELDTATDTWPGWMSAATAARYLDMPIARVYRLVQLGEIPYSQPGTGCKLSFERKSLDDWMRSKAVA